MASFLLQIQQGPVQPSYHVTSASVSVVTSPSLYPLLPTPTRWILTPWESGDRQGGLFSEPGGYLYSLSTCLCVPEIQNPHLEVSYCMSQNRGDTRYSTGLFQTPTSALTVQCSPITDYLVEILLTAPTTTTIT